ncbi:helix-turn-helix domain-containing protein [Catellatospora methionotrophica]|uniref:helix-turn-helix domain-containing protein n=1 Tax=Catellatospora methionotrophica TaxID=121620 RepID=UPI0033D5281C
MARRRPPGQLSDLPLDLPEASAALAHEMRLGRDKAGASLQQLATAVFSSKASISRWLNGQAMPSLDQAIRWAEACDTNVRTMRGLWEAANDPANRTPRNGQGTEPAEAPDPAPHAPNTARRRTIALAAATLALVVAAAAGWWALHRAEDTAGAPDAASIVPAWCSGHDLATVSVPEATATTDTVKVHIACLPPADDELILIVELLEQGQPAHSLYFAKEYLARPEPGDYSFEHNLTMSLVRSRRLLYVVNVPAASARDWRDTVKRNGQLELPAGARIVSNRAPNMRVA